MGYTDSIVAAAPNMGGVSDFSSGMGSVASGVSSFFEGLLLRLGSLDVFSYLIAALALIAVIGLTILFSSISKKMHQKKIDPKGSYFDGTTAGLIGKTLLAVLITAVTFGFAFPWAHCMLYRWEIGHTVIDGRRLKFKGRGGKLFWRYILWNFLTVITFGIFSFWYGYHLKKWQVKHTVFADDKGKESEFTGTAAGWFGNNLLIGLSVFTLGIAIPFAQVNLLKWEMRNTVIGGRRFAFSGSGGWLFGMYILRAVLAVPTLGIFPLLFPVKRLRWKYSNTHVQTLPIPNGIPVPPVPDIPVPAAPTIPVPTPPVPPVVSTPPVPPVVPTPPVPPVVPTPPVPPIVPTPPVVSDEKPE